MVRSKRKKNFHDLKSPLEGLWRLMLLGCISERSRQAFLSYKMWGKVGCNFAELFLGVWIRQQAYLWGSAVLSCSNKSTIVYSWTERWWAWGLTKRTGSGSGWLIRRGETLGPPAALSCATWASPAAARWRSVQWESWSDLLQTIPVCKIEKY